MGRSEQCILTNMCMIRDGDQVLLQERVNPDWPGVTFPGGHVEPGESFVSSVIREVQEETGLEIRDVRLCGAKQWSSRDGSYRYIVLLFRTESYSGELRGSREGRVFWADLDSLSTYPLSEGFESMLEVFLREDLSENYHYLQDGTWKARNL